MSVAVRVLADPQGALDAYASVSSAFEVRTVLDVAAGCIDGPMATWPVRRLATPYRKDYDAVQGNHPTDWPELLRAARTLQLGAHVGEQRVGGALLLFDCAEVQLLEGRRDLALLWDLRVAPSHRGLGIGTALFVRAMAWAREQGCSELLVETQDVNLPACRFYARQGCRLASVRTNAYAECPAEAQLLWRRAVR